MHRLGYRADIDGLRAIAVALVVTFHFFPAIAPGGFVGVDVFFVISGFLITSLIAENASSREFSLASFYARRIRRIFPSLVIVLIAALVLGWFILLPADYQTLGAQTGASAGFVANLMFWKDAGYFDAEAIRKPLLHLWSLGVEEQFYLVWPLLMLGAYRWFPRPNLAMLAIAFASFVLNLISIKNGHPESAFYSPLARLWELAVGGCLALSHSTISRRMAPVASLAGLAAIFGAALLIHPSPRFPGWQAAIPVAGTVLVIAAGPVAFPNRSLLAHRIVVAVGLISYPLYLWHWLLLSFATISGYTLGTGGRLTVVAVSVSLAAVTYYLIERPIRRWPITAASITALATMMAVTGAAGFLVKYFDGVPSRLPEIARDLTKVTYTVNDVMRDWRYGRCFIYPERDGGHFAPECAPQGDGSLFYLWGDSHAAALYPGLRLAAQERGDRVAQFTSSGCPPLVDWDVPQRPLCRGLNDWNLANIERISPKYLFLHADWLVGYYELNRIARTLDQVQSRSPSTKIVLIGPGPHWFEPVSNVLYRQWQSGPRTVALPLRISYREEETTKRIQTELRATAEAKGIQYFSLLDTFCNSEGCLSRMGNNSEQIIAFDGAHLSPAASAYAARALFGELLRR